MSTAQHTAPLPLEYIGTLDELAAELFTLDVVYTINRGA
jgi:hypothetical protein